MTSEEFNKALKNCEFDVHFRCTTSPFMGCTARQLRKLQLVLEGDTEPERWVTKEAGQVIAI